MTAQAVFAPEMPRLRPRIVLAEVAGVCFGVRRALDIAHKTRLETAGRLTTLGAIVHNEQVIERMRDAGIETEAELERITDGTVILSAHGVGPRVVEQAKRQNLNIVDVTCPFVTRVHLMAKKLLAEGYQIVLIGDPGHTEVKGILGTIEAEGGSATLVSTPKDAANANLGKKVGIISQTTQRRDDYAAIVAEISKRVPDVRALSTICGATDELQDAAKKLAQQVDVVIVVGGKRSANTSRLRQMCAEQGVPAYHIETADEIEPEWIDHAESIGITAGASTPDWLIEDVARTLNGGVLPDDWTLHHPDE
jgi:(E)-4-hydroxy-3-methyl-but-2-enyl pyrophosphate reductase